MTGTFESSTTARDDGAMSSDIMTAITVKMPASGHLVSMLANTVPSSVAMGAPMP